MIYNGASKSEIIEIFQGKIFQQKWLNYFWQHIDQSTYVTISNESLFTYYKLPLVFAGIEYNEFEVLTTLIHFSKLLLLLRGKQQHGCLKYIMAGMQYMPKLWAHLTNAVHCGLNILQGS